MMFEQIRYADMVIGAVYRCPPGGQVMLVLNNEHITNSNGDAGYITMLVLVAAGNVNWTGKEGMTVREPYRAWSTGSWTRVS